jgi:holo-[acyl-carrier protein] synthase
VIILGMGNDLVDIRRVARTIERFGDRFTHRVFTEEERRKAERRAEPAATYAKRFAAKEAMSKALGTGFRAGVFWSDIGVVNLPSGQPTLCLTGGARRRMDEMVPPGMEGQIFLTLTDEPPLAQAFVLLVAVPIGSPTTDNT